MRRRSLLNGSSIDYVFSAESTSVSVSSSSSSTNVGITSTANGTNIGYSVVSYDGTVVYQVITGATYITIRYRDNSTYDDRNGNVVLKQNDSNKTITITVSQSAKLLNLPYHGILLDGDSGSSGSIVFDKVKISDIPSWANVFYASGQIRVITLSDNSNSVDRVSIITVSVGSQSKSLWLIQLPSDYHSRDYVTIGGINWAIKNVGASSVQDYGNYYQWGTGAVTYQNVDQYHTGGTDSSYTLPSSADTATQVLGEGWRMPTKADLQALMNAIDSYYWVSYNRVNGIVLRVTGRNVLFFPAAGYYYDGSLNYDGSDGYVWSSTPYTSSKADALSFNNGYKHVFHSSRSRGLSVRGVHA